jgi:invasion protein IalB
MGGWVKICENVASKDRDGKDVRRLMCLTHYERLGPSGVTISAAVRQIEGFDKQHLMVSVPLGVLLQPTLRATVYPRDAWNKLLNGETVPDTKFELLTYTICHPAGCTAELEATPQVLEQIRAAGGMMVTATGPSGHPMTYPVPFAGFSEAHAGTPVDGTKYATERQAVLDRISKSRQK